MFKDIDIDIVCTGACSVARVRGDIDLNSSPKFRAAILELFRKCGPERVILDLQEAKRIDSSGITSLVEGLREARRRNARLILTGLNEAPHRILDLTRLTSFFEIARTVEDALG